MCKRKKDVLIEKMRKKAEAETEEMIKNGELILESDLNKGHDNMSKPKYVEPDNYLSPEMLNAFEEDDETEQKENNR